MMDIREQIAILTSAVRILLVLTILQTTSKCSDFYKTNKLKAEIQAKKSLEMEYRTEFKGKIVLY